MSTGDYPDYDLIIIIIIILTIKGHGKDWCHGECLWTENICVKQSSIEVEKNFIEFEKNLPVSQQKEGFTGVKESSLPTY